MVEDCKSRSWERLQSLRWQKFADLKSRYVGAENGVYEFHVNTTARKLYPSLAVR
jgi:hypothetical protein